MEGLTDGNVREEFDLDVGLAQTRVAPRGKGRIKPLPSAPWQHLGLIGEIGFAIALPIAGGALAGVFIDRTWSTAPKATLSLLFLGIVVSFVNVLKTVRTIIKNKS